MLGEEMCIIEETRFENLMNITHTSPLLLALTDKYLAKCGIKHTFVKVETQYVITKNKNIICDTNDFPLLKIK